MSLPTNLHTASSARVLSVCAHHSPVGPLDLTDGVLHATADRIAELRTAAAVHIGECRRGPIIAIPAIAEPS